MLAVILVNMTSIPVFAETDSFCGDNVKWYYNEGTSKLTVHGTGEMWDYSGTVDLPWFNYLDDIKIVEIERTVTKIGDFAFAECVNLETAIIPSSVTAIGRFAFSDCESLSNITIPESVVSIGNEAFMNCYSLREIKIPSGVQTLDNGIFCNCIGLETVRLPDSLITILFNVFENCTALENIYYSGTEAEWSKVSVWDGNDNLLNANFNFLKEDHTDNVPKFEENTEAESVSVQNEDNTSKSEVGTEKPTEITETAEVMDGDNANTLTHTNTESSDVNDEEKSVVQETEEPSVSNSKKNIIAIAIVVFIVEVLVVAIVLLVRKNKKKNKSIEY